MEICKPENRKDSIIQTLTVYTSECIDLDSSRLLKKNTVMVHGKGGASRISEYTSGLLV